MTDNTQELENLVRNNVHTFADEYLELDECVAALTAYTNKQIEQAYSDGFQKAAKGAFKSQQGAKREAVEAVLDRLDKSMPTAEQLATKYGYHMPEKQYGYKLGLHDIREVIEAERNKLEAGL